MFERRDFLKFYYYLCHVIDVFLLVFICSTKVSAKSDMPKFWETFSCSRIHKEEIFKCCGKLVYYYAIIIIFHQTTLNHEKILFILNNDCMYAWNQCSRNVQGSLLTY